MIIAHWLHSAKKAALHSCL